MLSHGIVEVTVASVLHGARNVVLGAGNRGVTSNSLTSVGIV